MTALRPIPSNWSLQMAKSGHVMVIWPCCKLPVLAANMILHMRNMLYHFIILNVLNCVVILWLFTYAVLAE